MYLLYKMHTFGGLYTIGVVYKVGNVMLLTEHGHFLKPGTETEWIKIMQSYCSLFIIMSLKNKE